MPSVVAYCDVYTAAFAGRRMATVLPRNRGLKTCGYRNKTRDSVPFRYATAATLTQYPHSSVPYLMLWGACAKRHCKSWQTQKNGFPHLAVAWGIRNFLHYFSEVPFSADS